MQQQPQCVAAPPNKLQWNCAQHLALIKHNQARCGTPKRGGLTWVVNVWLRFPLQTAVQQTVGQGHKVQWKLVAMLIKDVKRCCMVKWGPVASICRLYISVIYFSYRLCGLVSRWLVCWKPALIDERESQYWSWTLLEVHLYANLHASFALSLRSAAHAGNQHSKTWAPNRETILTTFFGSAFSPPPAFPCQHVLLSVICKCWANVMYCYTLFRFEGHRFSTAERTTRVGAFIFWDYSLLLNKHTLAASKIWRAFWLLPVLHVAFRRCGWELSWSKREMWMWIVCSMSATMFQGLRIKD